MTTPILGISAYYHDSAACLLRDGEIVAAAQEERFTRKKGECRVPADRLWHTASAPAVSGSDDLKYVGFYDKPCSSSSGILETYLGSPRRDSSRS
jgi:carbamoyltransferase